MRIKRLIRIAAVILLLVLAIGYILSNFPSGSQDTKRLLDFSEFYAAAQIVRHGLGHDLYDLKLQAEYQLQVAPVHAFYLRPPFETLLFLPLTYLSYRGAYIAWVLLSCAILALVARLIERNTFALEALSQYTRGVPVDFGLLLVILLAFAPTMNCFLIGQDSVLLLLVYTLTYLALRRGRELAAGALLACGLFKFHLVLPFVVIFLLRRRWSFLLGFSCGAAVLVIVSVLISGPGSLVSYPAMFLNHEYRTLMGFQPEYAANLRGLIYLGTRNHWPIFSAFLVILSSLTVLWIAARSWQGSPLNFSFAAAVIAALLTGFHSFVYDLTLLLLPVAIVCGELAKNKVLLQKTAFNTTLVLLFIPPIHHLLITQQIYALICVPLVILFGCVLKMSSGAAIPEMQTG